MRYFILICAIALASSACTPRAELVGSDECIADSAAVNLSDALPPVFRGEDISRIDSVIVAAIADSAFPGAAIAIGLPDSLVYMRGFGHATYQKNVPITEQSVYDLASMTKVVSTTTATMLLVEAGWIGLDDRVVEYLPDFDANEKDDITLRHLLTHSSGLIPFRPYHRLGFEDRKSVIDAIMSDSLQFEPGVQISYSDLGMITMGLVIERVTDMQLDDFTRRYIFNPLGMCDTGFRTRDAGDVTNIVPTEYDSTFRQQLVHGVVHDETAFLLGGTAGHAGLFSTANDLSRFARMMISGGRLDDRQFLAEETIREFTRREPEGVRSERGLGWDLKSVEGYSSAGSHFSNDSFGHTGYTGTSIWFDPEKKLYALLLTNRVHPTRRNRKISRIRPEFADVVAAGYASRSLQD